MSEASRRRKLLDLKEEVKHQEMLIRREVEELSRNLNVTEDQFLGLFASASSKSIDFGDREILKDKTRDELLTLPFDSYPLL